MVVVIIGEMFGNKTVHGPFHDRIVANVWIDMFGHGQQHEIVDLLEPVDLERAEKRAAQLRAI